MPAMLDDPSAPTIYRTSGAPPYPQPGRPSVPSDMLPRQVTLRDRVTIATIVPFASRHEIPASLLAYLSDQLNKEIEKGDTYPMMEGMSADSFALYWFQNFGAIMLLGDIERVEDVVEGLDWTTDCLGSFYIKPNYPGRSSHICNAGFLVTNAARNRGVGRLMGEQYIEWAPKLGYTYSVFNLVYETNVASCRIWDALGFKRIGRVPHCGALRSHPERLIDAIIYGRELGSEAAEIVSEERFDKIKYYLKTGKYPAGADRAVKSRLRSAATHYKLLVGADKASDSSAAHDHDDTHNDRLMLKDKEVIIDPARQYEIARATHAVQHGGINKTTATIAERYHWIRIKETVSLVIRNCACCKEPAKAPIVRGEASAAASGAAAAATRRNQSSVASGVQRMGAKRNTTVSAAGRALRTPSAMDSQTSPHPSMSVSGAPFEDPFHSPSASDPLASPSSSSCTSMSTSQHDHHDQQQQQQQRHHHRPSLLTPTHHTTAPFPHHEPPFHMLQHHSDMATTAMMPTSLSHHPDHLHHHRSPQDHHHHHHPPPAEYIDPQIMEDVRAHLHAYSHSHGRNHNHVATDDDAVPDLAADPASAHSESSHAHLEYLTHHHDHAEHDHVRVAHDMFDSRVSHGDGTSEGATDNENDDADARGAVRHRDGPLSRAGTAEVDADADADLDMLIEDRDDSSGGGGGAAGDDEEDEEEQGMVAGGEDAYEGRMPSPTRIYYQSGGLLLRRVAGAPAFTSASGAAHGLRDGRGAAGPASGLGPGADADADANMDLDLDAGLGVDEQQQQQQQQEEEEEAGRHVWT
ncbi:MAG: hypothetical protein M1818_003065 [Claussenomyces sp. TS43310]|nr:MAG: hypothetical protein M1818_003065 [Claussenomyces sp. TS43310]